MGARKIFQPRGYAPWRVRLPFMLIAVGTMIGSQAGWWPRAVAAVGLAVAIFAVTALDAVTRRANASR